MNAIDELSEQTYASIRNSILDLAKRGEDPDIMLVEYLDLIKLSFEPRVLNRLMKDSDPTLTAFLAVILCAFAWQINKLLHRLT
jgi:hypothetical protein